MFGVTPGTLVYIFRLAVRTLSAGNLLIYILVAVHAQLVLGGVERSMTETALTLKVSVRDKPIKGNTRNRLSAQLSGTKCLSTITP